MCILTLLYGNTVCFDEMSKTRCTVTCDAMETQIQIPDNYLNLALIPFDNPSLPSISDNATCRGISVDVHLLKESFESAVKIFGKQNCFHSEAALVSRLIYLTGRKLRHDIGLSYLKKTNAGLRKYLALNFHKLVKVFSKDTDSVPSREAFEFTMLRLQSLCAILTKITRSAFQSACFFFDRFKRGETAWMALIPYTVLSKVWSLAKRLSERSSELYSSLLPFRSKLKRAGFPLFPRVHRFPMSVDKWIRREFPEEKYTFYQKDKVNFVHGRLCEIAKELTQSDSTNIFEKDEESKENPVSVCYSKLEICSNTDEGIAVNRNELRNIVDINLKSDSISSKAVVKVKSDSEKRGHCFTDVIDRESLLKFLQREEAYRQENSSEALTSHIGFMQWQTIKNILLNISEKFKRKLFCKNTVKKMQHTWKERCK